MKATVESIHISLSVDNATDVEVSEICQTVANKVVTSLAIIGGMAVTFSLSRDGFPWISDAQKEVAN